MTRSFKRNKLAAAIRAALMFWLVLMLVACGPVKDDPPIVPKVVEVVVTKTVPVPDALTGDCQNTTPKEQTYAEAKRLALVRGEYLDECTQRMRKIRALK